MIHVRMYVRMYVRTYVCTYVCMYVRTYVRTYGAFLVPYVYRTYAVRMTSQVQIARTEMLMIRT